MQASPRRHLLAVAIAALVVAVLALGLPWFLRDQEERGARELVARGESLLLEGNTAAAEDAFRKALARDAGNPRAARALADILFARGDWGGARALYETARRGGLLDVDLLRKLGIALLESGEPDGAAEVLRAALAFGGGDAPRIRVPLARALHETGDDPGAEEALTRALLESPRDIPVLLALASLREEHGRLDEALALYGRAVAADPRALEPHKRRGAVLARAGRYEEAAVSYRNALDLAPDDVDTLILLGNALESLDRTGEARAYFESALNLDPKSFLATIDLAALEAREGRAMEAASLLEQAMDLDPESPFPPLFLGRLLAGRGKTSDARLLVEHAIRLGPELADPHFELGALLRFTDPGRAEEELRKALVLDPGHVDAHRALADILISRGEKSEAALHLRVVVARRPDDGPSRALLQRIEQSLQAPPGGSGPPAPSAEGRQDQGP